MADSSDVEIALAALVGGVLFPGGVQGVGGFDIAAAGGWSMAGAYGTAAPQSSAAGLPIRVYRGWPTVQQLDADLAVGTAHVSIIKGTGMGRVAQGVLDDEKQFPGPPPTISATVSGYTVTLAGTPAPYTLIGLLLDRQGYVWTVQATDTLLTIAAGLAAQISGTDLITPGGLDITDLLGSPITTDEVVTVTEQPNGAVTLIFGTTDPIVTRVETFGVSVRRSRQQTEQFKVTCWAPTPATRDSIGKFVDGALADLRWLPLADQVAWILWAGSRNDDVPSKAALWRRDLNYNVLYYTTVIRVAPPMLFGVQVLLINGAGGSASTTTS
jgi:hypothetical protein